MFEQDTSQSFVQARPETVLDIYNSINRSTVAVPGREPEPAQAFIVSVYRDNLYHAYVYLYLAGSNEGLLYRWSEGGVPGDRLTDVYHAALEFTESMGFMMDDMHYRDKTPEEKAGIFSELPVFHEDLSFMKSQARPEEKGEEQEGDLLIEPIEEEEAVELEVTPEDAEEINLDVIEDDELEPKAPEAAASAETGGGEAPPEESVVLGGGEDLAEEEKAEPVEVEEVSLDEEDQALQGLEIKEEEAAPQAPAADSGPEVAEEDILLDSLEAPEGSQSPSWESPPPDEQTMEAPPPAEAIVQEKTEAEPEVELTPEEAEVLGEALAEPEAAAEAELEAEEPPQVEEIEVEAEISPQAASEPAPEAPPPASPEPEPAPPAQELAPEPPPPQPSPRLAPPPAPSPPASAPAPAGVAVSLEDGELTKEEYELLVRLLAMM